MAKSLRTATPEFKFIQPKRYLYQAAQEAIKNYIIENGLKPGDPLPPEIELTRVFKVSRTSVREAVKSLESLGMIEARSGSGLFVKSFSFETLLDHFAYGLAIEAQDLADILQVRFQLEYGMIPMAVEKQTPAQMERLRQIVKRMKQGIKKEKYSAEDDRLFHQTLWENVDNKLMQKILDIFWMIFYQARKRAAIPEPPNLQQMHDLHFEIVEALKEHDVEKAQRSMLTHMKVLEQRLKTPKPEAMRKTVLEAGR